MRNKIFVVCCCVTFGNWVKAQSLSDMYALALQNDYKFKIAQSAYLAGQEAENLAQVGLRSKINAETTWVRSEITTDLNSSNPFAIGNKNIQDVKGAGYTISLTQPLIDLVALHDYKGGELSAKISALQLDSAKSSLIIRTSECISSSIESGS